jgi:hypothetical protein
VSGRNPNVIETKEQKRDAAFSRSCVTCVVAVFIVVAFLSVLPFLFGWWLLH